VVLAILCGYLFNAIQPSLMLGYSQPEQETDSLTIDSREQISASTIKEEPKLPSTPALANQTANQNVAGSSDQSQSCSGSAETAYQQALAAENEYHKQQLESLDSTDGLRKIIGNLSGASRDRREAEYERHEQKIEEIKKDYEQAPSSNNC
jgi:hypothetical protein